jgi:hypothetical protein
MLLPLAQPIVPAQTIAIERGWRSLREAPPAHERRCLLVLDTSEALFEPGRPEGRYRTGMEGGDVLQRIGEAAHESCRLLTSRWAPPDLGGAWRSAGRRGRREHSGRLQVRWGHQLRTHRVKCRLSAALHTELLQDDSHV